MASAPVRRSKRGLSVGNADPSIEPSPSTARTTRSANQPALSAPPPKRSRAEIQRAMAEKQTAKVKDMANQVQQLEKQEAAGIKAIAAIEDRIRKEQWEAQIRAEHPDIPTFDTYQPAPSFEATLDIPMDTDEPGNESEGGLDIPVDTDSDGLGLGGGQLDNPSGGDCCPPSEDDDKDLDGLEDAEELKAAYQKVKAALAQKKKEQQTKGALRAQVNKQRKLQSVAPVPAKQIKDGMDKTESDMVVKERKDGAGAKKKSALEGFKKHWDQAPAPTKPCPVTSESTPTTTNTVPIRQSKASRNTNSNAARLPNPNPTLSQADDTPTQSNSLDDESPAIVKSARELKATALSQKGGTSKMGLSVKKGKISASLKASAVPKKHNYSTKDLPLDGIKNGVARWRDEALPIVLAWGSTLPDPFAINSNPFFEAIVKSAWDEVFGEEGVEFSVEVAHVASAAIRTWRSGIGKAALKILADHFRQPGFGNQEARGQFVRDQLSNLRYVYEDPANEKGAYRAPLLLQVFAVHQTEVENTDAFYGHPVGALAFAATSLERALKFWSNGVLAESRANFVRGPWIDTINKHIGYIDTLKDGHWAKIEAATAPFVTASCSRMVLDSDENANVNDDVIINISDDD
ncbi:hypothetical protein H1R20_g9667, partial [Candolleomyces eurysporus]